MKEFYRVYDENRKLLGQLFCDATEIRNELPNAKYIKVLQQPYNIHIFKDIDEEIRDKYEMR